MPIQTNFKKTTDGSGDTERKLQQLELNVQLALKRIESFGAPRLKTTNLKIADYTAVLDDLVVCGGTLTVTLPAATQDNQGREIAIERQAGTITVIQQKPGGLVQGATSDSLSTTGIYHYHSDGVNWYR